VLKWLREVERSEISAYFMEILLKVLLDTTIDPLDDLKGNGSMPQGGYF
jgi:hypothetical protein